MPDALAVPYTLTTVDVPARATQGFGPFPPPEPPAVIRPVDEGDEEATPIPAAPRRIGRRMQLYLQEPGGGPLLGEFRSAWVDKWDDPDGMRSARCTGHVSQYDELWDDLGLEQTIVAGRRAVKMDPKGFNGVLLEDGEQVFAGFFDTPLDMGGDRFGFDLTGGMGMLDVAMQSGSGADKLAGRGDFEGYSNIGQAVADGWYFGPDVEAEIVNVDPYSGIHELRVRGIGYFASPNVTVLGSEHFRWGYVTSAVARQTGDPDRTPLWFGAWTQPYGTISAFTRDWGSNGSDVSSDEWESVDGRVTLPRGIAFHSVRAYGRVAAADWVYLDQVRIVEDMYTGAAIPEDLNELVFRAIKAGPMKHAGHGLGINFGTPTGVAETVFWFDHERKTAREAIEEIVARLDGPEVWCDAKWIFNVSKRRGANIDGYVFDRYSVYSASWSRDAGAAVDDHVTFTGVGSGAGQIVISHHTPVIPGRRRVEAAVRAPEGPYARQAAWAKGTASLAAREQTAGEFVIDYEDGRRLRTGDGVRCALSDGFHIAPSAVRISNRVFVPAAETCTVEWGVDPVVDF